MNLPIHIIATAHCVPTQQVSSAELDEKLGLAKGKVERVGGVKTRYFAKPQETAAQLAAEAACKALLKSGLDWQEIDALVAFSATMDQGMPSNAALIHRELGLSATEIPAFDINASCLGFLAALDTLSWAMTAGRYRRVLLVGADLASCGLNWQHLEASAIFGDGAAAVIISNEGGGRLLASDFMTISEGVDYCCIPAGGSRYHPNRGVCVEEFSALAHFQMQGKAVFKLASQYLPAFLTRLLAKAKLSLSEIDWIVPHQASHLALQHMQQRLGFAAEKVVNIFAHYGNQVSASLPTALDIAISKDDIQRGQTILLLGTGAGLSIAGAVLQF